jgi:hypothetical protein
VLISLKDLLFIILFFEEKKYHEYKQKSQYGIYLLFVLQDFDGVAASLCFVVTLDSFAFRG